VFHGVTMTAAVSALGAALPVKLLRATTTGWPDLLPGLNSCARSVSGGVAWVPFAERPFGGVAPKVKPVWHLNQTWYS
jgi:hypothetical protein